jgi:hypothetical protein
MAASAAGKAASAAVNVTSREEVGLCITYAESGDEMQ